MGKDGWTGELFTSHFANWVTAGSAELSIHFGDDSPGDDTHSLMRDAVSSCRALRNSSSRSLP